MIELMLGVALVIFALQASRRSSSLGRYFWRLTAAAYSLWVFAQVISTYDDMWVAPVLMVRISNTLFSLWFIPLGMALFLDPDYEPRGFDWVLILDSLQAMIFGLAAYLYFFYIPSLSGTGTDLVHSMLPPYFIYYAVLIAGFCLRSLLTQSSVVRALFGRMGIFLFVSCLGDVLYFYSKSSTTFGVWFDLLWSVLLVLPMMIAATWDESKLSRTGGPMSGDLMIGDPISGRAQKLLVTQLFPLLYPLLILVMSAGIAKSHTLTATIVVLTSFVGSSARLLVTQHRMFQAQEALRREASHDGLTNLWNRMAILDILQHELFRSERSGTTVGIIMADVDHFKSVNDTHGHPAGDAVLRAMAKEVGSVLRPYDSLGRYGGEEFLIVAPGCGLLETAELAERVRAHIQNHVTVVKGRPLTVTLSLGIATGSLSSDLDRLLHAADETLYAAKNRGRNRVEPALAPAYPSHQKSAQ
jgi:diguanylate cyclase (GGDEF)-like protein